MNRVQFALLIGSSIGSYVLVILAWLNSDARLSRLESHVDSGFADVRSRLANIDNHLMTFYTVTGKA